MPKVKKNTKYTKGYSEENIQDAINAINNGMAQRQASKQYGVPRSTLQFKMSSAFTKTTPGPPPVIGIEKEKELVEWIFDCHQKGFSRREENIQASIKYFLDQSNIKTPFKDNCPGDGWYKNFLRRHPSLSERFAEGVTAASSCVSESDIRNWFKRIEEYLSNENYLDILNDPSRIFNSDETYFQVCPKLKYVLAPRGARNVYEVDKGASKLNLTVLFTFSAKGVTTPPTMVYPYKRLPSAVGQSVPEGWGIGVTPSGYMCRELFSDYLQNIFYPYLLKEKIPLPVVLFVDGHSSHISLELSNLCSELQIILICLYPNSTRLLQPADVAAFKPLKNMWKKSVLNWRKSNPTENMTLDKMGPLLKTAVDSFSPEGKAIQNGFKACGLYPWNPDAVDYSKCLGTSVGSVSNDDGSSVQMDNIHNKSPLSTSCITYETFTELVGPTVMNNLYSSQPGIQQDKSSQEFLILLKLWQEFQKNNLNDKSSDQSNSLTQTVGSSEASKGDLNVQTSLIHCSNLEVLENVENIDIQQCVIIDDSNIDVILDNNSSIIDLIETDDGTNYLDTNKSNATVLTDIEETRPIKLDNIPMDSESSITENISSTINNNISSIDNDSSVIASPMNKDTHTLNNNPLTFKDQDLLYDRDAFNDRNKTDTNTETFCDENETLGAVLDLSLTYGKNRIKAFHEFLEKPPILMRKGKKFTEKTSYALSSNEWKAHKIKKIEKQKQEFKNKGLKKIAAAEKKKLAEREKALKKQVALQKKKRKKKEKQEFLQTSKNMEQEESDTNTKNTKVNKSNARKRVKKTDQNVVDKSRVFNDIGNLVADD